MAEDGISSGEAPSASAPRPVEAGLRRVRERISSAAVSVGRDPGDVRLVAVSKTRTEAEIEAAKTAGAKDLGENYVQELVRKAAAIEGARWHFIGRLQRNKVRRLAGIGPGLVLFHALDSERLAAEIEKRFKRPLDCLIEVNLSGETSKGGLPPEAAADLISTVARMERVRIRGLMTMPPYRPDPEESRPFFAALRRLRDDLSRDYTDLTELSMGMSNDFEVAIEEGATIVRIGTAIFGERAR